MTGWVLQCGRSGWQDGGGSFRHYGPAGAAQASWVSLGQGADMSFG